MKDFFIFLTENDLPQTLLLEDEQKQILEARQNTDMSSLVVFKVGIHVASFAVFFLLITYLFIYLFIPPTPSCVIHSYVNITEKNNNSNS